MNKLNKKTVALISRNKKEPKWMLEFRLHALEAFKAQAMPKFGPDLSKLDFDKICYYIDSKSKLTDSWNKVPQNLNKTFKQIGVQKAEKSFLGGSSVQYNSEKVYQNLQKRLSKKGVIFSDIETALKTHPKIVKKYFATIVPVQDNKFTALNSAMWSGGTFLYVPPKVKVKQSLQAYFRINAEQLGQFERTLIIADKGSEVNYIEGCSARKQSKHCMHAAVVEIIALPGSKIRYTTIQNWSKNVYNLVTKRAFAYKKSKVEWVDFNLGSGVTMKYPTVFLKGQDARTHILSMAMAGSAQNQDTGARAVHLAPKTSSKIVSKSIAKSGGKVNFRGLIKVNKDATGAKSKMECHSLIMDSNSSVEAMPSIDTGESDVSLEHEASVSKISQDQLFYLMSRGLSKNKAENMIVNGFVEQLTQKLPLEYAVEMNRMISMEYEH